MEHGWELVQNWECLFVHRQRGLLLSVYVDDINLAARKENLNPMWKVLNNEVDLGEPTSWDVLNDIAKHANILLTLTEPRSDPKSPQEQRINYHARKLRIFLRGPTTWEVMSRSV